MDRAGQDRNVGIFFPQSDRGQLYRVSGVKGGEEKLVGIDTDRIYQAFELFLLASARYQKLESLYGEFTKQWDECEAGTRRWEDFDASGGSLLDQHDCREQMVGMAKILSALGVSDDRLRSVYPHVWRGEVSTVSGNDSD